MRTLEAMGQTFTLQDHLSADAVFTLAEVTDEASMMQNVRALRDLLKDVIVPEDWRRFRQAMTDTRIGLEELQKVFQSALEAEAERPTGALSDSSDGRTTIEPKSAANSDDKVSGLFPGRPDLQLAISRSA